MPGSCLPLCPCPETALCAWDGAWVSRPGLCRGAPAVLARSEGSVRTGGWIGCAEGWGAWAREAHPCVPPGSPVGQGGCSIMHEGWGLTSVATTPPFQWPQSCLPVIRPLACASASHFPLVVAGGLDWSGRGPLTMAGEDKGSFLPFLVPTGSRISLGCLRKSPLGVPLAGTGPLMSWDLARGLHACVCHAVTLCFLLSGRKSKAKPNGKKPAAEEKKMYLEPEYTKSRITDVGFKELVVLPREIDLNEWLASNSAWGTGWGRVAQTPQSW